jgi:hypothetical protein
MLRKLKTIQWPGATKEQSLPALLSEAQEYISTSVAALWERLAPLARGMEGRIVSLHGLLRNTFRSTKLRVLDDGHAILQVCTELWTTYTGRRRRQTVIYLWVIALGIALGLAVELAPQISALLQN